MMMPTVLPAALRGLALAGVVVLAACGGVGKGILPQSSVLLPAGGAEGDTTLKAYTCMNTALSLIVNFSNGSRGDFTSRAKWSSNKPDVVKVSNRDIEVPDQPGFFFGHGVLVPVAAGTATISVSYLDFKNSITVTVEDPTNFKITPSEANLAIGSSTDLSLTADLGGVNSSVDGFASWKFKDTAPAATVVTLNASTGTLSSAQLATSTPGSFTVSASIPGCSLKNVYGLDSTGAISVPGAVDRLASLQLSKEFTGSDKLVVNTTERYTATGTLANGKTQDLSAQVVFAALKPSDVDPLTDDENVVSDLATFLAGTTRNLLFATKAGVETGTDANSIAKNQAHLRATFSFREPDTTAASGEKITTISTDASQGVRQIAITPVAPTLSSIAASSVGGSTKLAPGNTLRLKAVGTYAVDASTNLTQDITRHVVWEPRLTTETNGDTLTVQSSVGSGINILAGVAVASTRAVTGKVVTVKASKLVSATDTKSGTVDISIDPTEPQEIP